MTLGHLRTLQLCGRLRARGHALKAGVLAAEWEAVDATKRRAEATMAGRVGAVLRAALDDAAGCLAETTAKADPPNEVLTTLALDLDALVAALADELPDAVVEMLRAGFAAASLRIERELTFDADRPAVRDVVTELLEKADSVPFTLRSRLDTVIRDGLASGMTRDELAAAVREAAPDMAASQAEAIAQTTGTGAFERGQLEAFREAGTDGKRWLSQRDGEVRPAHDAADGQEVPIDEAFDVGGERLMHPADPKGSKANIIRCRCTSLPVALAQKATGLPWRVERDERIRTLVEATKADYASMGACFDAVVEQMNDPEGGVYVSRSIVERAVGWK